MSPDRWTAFTGVHIVLEVMHRLMMLEALQKGLITGGQPARKLKEQPEIIKVLQEYNQSVQHIPRLNIRVRTITSGGCQSQRSHPGAGRVDDERFGNGGVNAQSWA